MSPLMKNITVALITITLAFAGYYMYSQNKNSGLNSDNPVSSTQDMLISTQIFIERRTLLDQVDLDTRVFSDPLFSSYRSFSKPLNQEAVGRNNPFVDTSSANF